VHSAETHRRWVVDKFSPQSRTIDCALGTVDSSPDGDRNFSAYDDATRLPGETSRDRKEVTSVVWSNR
jgi:hypothetical protein